MRLSSADAKIRQIPYANVKTTSRFEILSAVEKICHIPHAIFQTTSRLKLVLDKSVNNVLGEGM